ncbi:MAG: hypothetical protein Q8M40_00445 [Legionella sp.]|nr:hypothetical protein [Legionella sp.]
MKFYMRQSIFLLLLIFSSLIHSNEHKTVTLWVQGALLNTLSLSYKDKPLQESPNRINYTFNAWNAITGFLGGYMKTVRARELTLSPQPVNKPTVVNSGVVSGIQFWRVNQSILLPELTLQVDFSLVVLARDPTTGGPYIIQSMDIRKKQF